MDASRYVDPTIYAGKMVVLVLDDLQHMRSLVSSMLGQWHRPVAAITAENTDRAMEYLDRFQPAVVISNSNLDFIHQVRNPKTSPNPYVPIIMLTSHVELPLIMRARDGGVNEFLAKPVSVHALLSRLSAVINHPRPFVREKSYFGPDRRRRNLGPPKSVVAERRKHTAELFDTVMINAKLTRKRAKTKPA